MKTRLLLFASLATALTVASSAVAQDEPKSLALGARAPLADTRMKSVDGSDVTIARAAGKHGTLVVFTCNHCPWAQAWQSRVAAIGNAALGEGIGVVAINPNDPGAYPEDGYAEMQARSKSVGYKFPYVVDATSDVARAFGASRTPEAFLFDAEGKLVYHGTVDDNARDPQAVKFTWLRDAVDAVAAGKPVPVAETKAFGCSIKLRARRSI